MKAKMSSWWLMIYVYFTADFPFRVVRDRYLFPIQMPINALELIAIIPAARFLFNFSRSRTGSDITALPVLLASPVNPSRL
jgi:hypothetical protein